MKDIAKLKDESCYIGDLKRKLYFYSNHNHRARGYQYHQYNMDVIL